MENRSHGEMTPMDSYNSEHTESHVSTADKKSRPTPDYTKLVQAEDFKALMQAKKRFTIPSVIAFTICYFSLPILATYTDWLNGETIFGFTYVWLYAFMQFFMIWGVGQNSTEMLKQF